MSSDSKPSYKRYNPAERRSGHRWEQSESRTDRKGRHPAGQASTYGLLKSTVGVPCRTEFVNRTGVTLRVLWLDFQGEKVQYSVMPPGGSYRGLLTYSTHPWVLEDPEGTVYAVYVGGSATVTVHGRDSFTVVSGVQRRNRAAKDSVWSRVTEKLKQGSGVDTNGAANVKNTDVAEVNGQGGDTKESVTKSAGKQAMRKQRRGFLGWCFPNAADLKEPGESVIPDEAQKVEAEKAVQGCSICCETLQQDVWALKCGHVFHGECLAAACERQLQCPVCRQEIAGEADLQRIYLN